MQPVLAKSRSGRGDREITHTKHAPCIVRLLNRSEDVSATHLSLARALPLETLSPMHYIL